MVDIEKFKSDLIDAKAIKDSEASKELAHAQDLLKPFFDIVVAANEVFPETVDIRGITSTEHDCTTTIDVKRERVEFVTQFKSATITIRGMATELAKEIALEKPTNRNLQQIIGINDERTIKKDQITQAETAFAEFLKNQLT